MGVMNPRTVGDVVNTTVLIVAVVYQILTYGHFKNYWVLSQFGSNWANDGFCLSFKGTYYHTHLLCFYGDVVLASCLWMLSRNESRPELRIVKDSCLSVIGHGAAHAFLWVRDGMIDVYDPGKGSRGIFDVESALGALGATLFFTFFLHALNQGPLWMKVTQSLVHGVVLSHFVPLILAFSYVNTVLFVNLTLTQLWYGLGGKKDGFYLLFSLFGSASVMVAAIVEPLTCDSFLVNWGGHILFDYSIPITSGMYLLLGKYYLKPRQEKEGKGD
jgi:hypothetical protein